MSRESIKRLKKPANLAAVALTVALGGGAALWGQNPEPVAPPAEQTLTADQLGDLVAPIALYPDPLLGQILVASTYPLEVVEAGQWLQKNPGLSGTALTEAAQPQNWDPSVQALVVFPDVVKLLTSDVTWTTNLGNAFLSQQSDVMAAVQTMRQRAEQNGKLASSPEENVSTTQQDGQPAIAIEPANPDMMYVPEYDPAWIWGPAVYYPYPAWYWPGPSIIVGGLGFGFYPGVNVGFFFGGGWGGWGAWGWHPAWGTRAVVVNNTFIHRYNLNTSGLASLRGTTVWSHTPIHRQGVPYSNAALNSQYRQDVNRNLAIRSEAGQAQVQRTERMGNRSIPANTPPARNGSAFAGAENGRAAQVHADHGFSSMGPARSAPAARGGGGRKR
ncbi:MAG: DUF3300 domain-containing protein [Bryobacteraceae bacterium]